MKIEEIVTQIELLAHYYLMPIESNDFPIYEKGLHKGRAEGLIIAHNLLTKGKTGIEVVDDFPTPT